MKSKHFCCIVSAYSPTIRLPKVLLLLSLAIGFIPLKSAAGPLEAPASATNSASAMFTVQDIYNRIVLGTPGALRQGSFVEPSAGPTNGTGRTLNEIMNALPSATNAAVAATAADVPAGLKFWSLSATGWGLQIGTAQVQLNKIHSDVVTGISATNVTLGKRLPTAAGGTGIIVGQFSVSGISGAGVTDKNGSSMTVVQAQNGEVRFTIPPGTGINRYTLSISNQIISPVSYLPSQSNGLFLAYDAPVVTAVSGCIDNGPATVECDFTGNSIILIQGKNFGTNSSEVSVTVGGIPATFLSFRTNDTVIRVRPAPAPAGGYDLPVIVTVAGVTSSPAPLVSYAGPTVISNTVNLGPSYNPSGTTFKIYGSGLDLGGTPGNFRFGPPGNTFDQMPYEATVVSTGVDASGPYYLVNLPTGGAGSGLVCIAHVGLQYSRPSGTYSYDAMSAPYQLRPAGPIVGPETDVYGSSVNGCQEIDFNALNAGNRADLLKAFLVSSDVPPSIVQCSEVSVISFDASGTTIRCKTPAGVGGTAYHLKLVVFSTSSQFGAYAYVYPVGPGVTSISGCNDSGNTTTCETEGGTVLSLTGTNFAQPFAVMVGGVLCRDIALLSSTQAQCIVPPGTGQSLPVVVQSAGNLSQLFNGFSYVSPVIDGLQGAVTVSNKVFNISRTNGAILTISGSNFGASGARVLVGGAIVTNVVHDTEFPHRKLTFQCPPRLSPPFYELPVVVISAGGSFSSNVGTLSYE
ncbi:MAG: hypothetical protein JWM68_1199 [Verrucomicrobiales bacterium]|nr:hypothetical protein [Verrucomicrobiales bacterium]